MRILQRLTLCMLVLVLTGGPIAVAAAPLSHRPTIGAPSSTGSHPWTRVLALVGSLAVFGAIRIADVGTLSNKFVARAQAAAPEYKAGVAQAGADWESNTSNAEPSYQAGVQSAISRGAYAKGVRNAGSAKYIKNATEKGAVRYAPGVSAAKEDWAKGFAPYHQLLSSMTLPPSGPRRSPQNQARANFVAAELGKMAESR